MFDVVGIGLNAIDYLCCVPRYPMPGEKLRMTGFSRQGGGQVATALGALSRWGLRTMYVGNVGDDEHGRLSLSLLREEGMEVSRARTAPWGWAGGMSSMRGGSGWPRPTRRGRGTSFTRGSCSPFSRAGRFPRFFPSAMPPPPFPAGKWAGGRASPPSRRSIESLSVLSPRFSPRSVARGGGGAG